MFYACVEDKFTDNDPEQEVIGLDPPSGEHEDVFNEETETIYLSESSISTNNCVTNSDGILNFVNKDCFVSVYKSIVNHDNVRLDDWENALGFTSLWTYYDVLEQDSTYNDWKSDSLRCKNVYFERLLNDSSKLRIGDSTFKYNFTDSTINIYDHTTGNSNTVAMTPFFGAYKTTWACDNDKVCTRRGTYKSPWRIKMSKVNRNSINKGVSNGVPLSYSDVYFTVTNYRKNTLGIYKKKVKSLSSFIDRWHEFRARVYSGSSITWNPSQQSDLVYTNKKWVENDQSSFTVDLNIDGIPTVKNTNMIVLCIEKWERHHNYVDGDINNDFHHDAW